MRGPAEILFRLRQEAVNARLWLAPPSTSRRPSGRLPLPDPAAATAVIDPVYKAELLAVARRIAGGELPAFDTWIRPDGEIRWRKDYRHGRETAPAYFRRVPYLDFQRAGDHKWIWEINRHQHLVTLAQAWTIDPDPLYPRVIEAQLESWLDQNPPQCGINWASALEVAFRALSWIWIWHLAGAALSKPLADRFLQSLYLHGLHLEANLSVYFSPNTHLLGEALALDALGRLFGCRPDWVETGSRYMEQALRRQVQDDGSHFEQSSYYHVYALDMFLLHGILAGKRSAEYNAVLKRMAVFLQALLGQEGRIPLLGDDDGGRLFHPFGGRGRFGRATLAVYHAWTETPAPAGWVDAYAASEIAAWWLAAPAPAVRPAALESELFPSAGLAFLRAGDAEVIADAGPFGPGSGGHSHADTLQILVRRGGREALIDPGTCTYIASPELRERFRGPRAHSTVSVAGFPQAVSAGPFRWSATPRAAVVHWRSGAATDQLAAECSYGEIRHRRWLVWEKEAPRLWVADQLDWDTPGVIHELEQTWQLGEEPVQTMESTLFCAGARLALEPTGKLSMQQVWRSAHYGHQVPATAVSIYWRSASPARRIAMIDWSTGVGPVVLRAEWERSRVVITGGDALRMVVNLETKERGNE